MKKLLGQVSLCNDYKVCEDGTAYMVTGENRRDQHYECRVLPDAISYLCRRLKGQRVTTEQAS